MGYYTFYALEAEDGEAEEHSMTISMASGYGGDLFREPTKWYNHNNDMLKYSARNPDILFTLYGEGENKDDLWVNYYRNGKMQGERATITYPDFDQLKLK